MAEQALEAPSLLLPLTPGLRSISLENGRATIGRIAFVAEDGESGPTMESAQHISRQLATLREVDGQLLVELLPGKRGGVLRRVAAEPKRGVLLIGSRLRRQHAFLRPGDELQVLGAGLPQEPIASFRVERVRGLGPLAATLPSSADAVRVGVEDDAPPPHSEPQPELQPPAAAAAAAAAAAPVAAESPALLMPPPPPRPPASSGGGDGRRSTHAVPPPAAPASDVVSMREASSLVSSLESGLESGLEQAIADAMIGWLDARFGDWRGDAAGQSGAPPSSSSAAPTGGASTAVDEAAALLRSCGDSLREARPCARSLRSLLLGGDAAPRPVFKLLDELEAVLSAAVDEQGAAVVALAAASDSAVGAPPADSSADASTKVAATQARNRSSDGGDGDGGGDDDDGGGGDDDDGAAADGSGKGRPAGPPLALLSGTNSSSGPSPGPSTGPRYFTRRGLTRRHAAPAPERWTGGLAPGAFRRLDACGTWRGGRLLLVSPADESGGAGACEGAARTYALLDGVDRLYRDELPDLSVLIDRQEDKVDYIEDTIIGGDGCLTAALVAGADRPAYEDEPVSLFAALTLRVCAEGYAELLTCAVRRRHRRRGFGTLLGRWVQALGVESGLRCMLVAAAAESVPFWRRLGFGPPPDGLPPEWRARLQKQFEDGSVSVLHVDLGRSELPAEGLQRAIDALVADDDAAGHAANAKRQRFSVQ